MSNLGAIISISRSNDRTWLLRVRCPSGFAAKVGDSIAVDGCCLTVIAAEDGVLDFSLMLETLARTTFPRKCAGERVHVEQSAALHDLVHGHQLTGHVSGTVLLASRQMEPDGSLVLAFRLPGAASLLELKGCVAVDGVSLTVSDLGPDSFCVSLIPHTQRVTLLSEADVGSAHNVELPSGRVVPPPDCPDPMALALEKSLLGRITAPSNPWVGCVILDGSGAVAAVGYHRKRGEKHAEVDALSRLPPDLDRSACTLYCTLEPCNHTGLQPPCTEAILRSGIRRVVVGVLDPDERVAGSGIERLRTAGLQVSVLRDERVARSLAPYVKHRQTKRPYVVGKLAISLDGKIAPRGVGQFPISCRESREHAHVLRLKSQAILVGTTTALLDEPRLDVRLPDSSKHRQASLEHRPLRCFLDLAGKVTRGPLLDASLGPTLVFTCRETCSPASLVLWAEKGTQIAFVDQKDGQIALDSLLDELGRRGVLQLLVEGGSRLFSSFLRAQLFDRLVFYVAPLFLGEDAVPCFSGEQLVGRYVQDKVRAKGGNAMISYLRPANAEGTTSSAKKSRSERDE